MHVIEIFVIGVNTYTSLNPNIGFFFFFGWMSLNFRHKEVYNVSPFKFEKKEELIIINDDFSDEQLLVAYVVP